MSENETYVHSPANRDVQLKVVYFEKRQSEQAGTIRKSYSENRGSFRPKIAPKPKKRLPTPTPSAKYEKENSQRDADYESTTSQDIPTDAFRPKEGQPSTTPSARYERGYSQYDAVYESATSQDVPTDAYRPKKRLPSPTPSARYEEGNSQQDAQYKSATSQDIPTVAFRPKRRLPSRTQSARYERRNNQQNVEYESATLRDIPTVAYKPKKGQSSSTPSARYEARHFSDSKVAVLLESIKIDEREDWSEHDLEVFQRPLCLVSAGENNVLQVDQKVLEQLRKINLPCVIVAIVGLYRTGKSYLMNCLADADKVEGFALGDTVQSQTKGIWVWCKRHPRIADTILVLLDTEGLGDVQKGDTSHDNRIITLATLLCSTLVYNMKGAFDQDAVNKLTFVSEMAKNIRFGGRCDENNSMLTCILPGFVLVLRDFSLKMKHKNGKITPDEYLETSLETDDKHGEDFNKPRESIRKFFPSGKRKCFALPVPGDADVLDELEELPFDALSKRFKKSTLEFMEFIFNQEPKQLMISKPVTGSMLAVLTNQYVEALRQGAVPDVSNAFEVVAEMENTKVKNTALAMFRKGLVEQKMPVPYKQLNGHFQSIQCTALEYIRNNAMLDTKHNVEKDVQFSMEYLWVKRKSENEEHISKYCENSLEALQSKGLLIDGIHNKSYAVVGGHIEFKSDLERVRQEYHLELKDKGYENRETATTWSTFMQTLAKPELEIIQLDNSLSEEENKKEREEMQRMVQQMEEQNKQLLEEQSASYKAQQQEIEEQRDKQDREHQEKMTQLIQNIADLETDKYERQYLQQRILLLEEEDKERRKEERQWREYEQRRRDESEKKRDEELRQLREDEKERYKRAEKDLRTTVQNLQQKSDQKDEEMRNLKEEKERKESERKKLGVFGKIMHGFKEYM